MGETATFRTGILIHGCLLVEFLKPAILSSNSYNESHGWRVLENIFLLGTVKLPGYLPECISDLFWGSRKEVPTKDSSHSSVRRHLHYPWVFKLYTSDITVNSKIYIDRSDNMRQINHMAATLVCISESQKADTIKGLGKKSIPWTFQKASYIVFILRLLNSNT